MSAFYLRTLGALELSGPDPAACDSLLRRPKRLAVLVYLLMAGRGSFVSRDRLLALFWPEADESRARRSLNQTVHQLRRTLGEGAILTRGEEVAASESVVECDAATLVHALEEDRREEALRLYGGDFLPGFFVPGAPDFEAWLSPERHGLRRRLVGAALDLAEVGDTKERTAGWARRAADLLDFDETALQRVIHLLDAAGDRAGALDIYNRYARRLAAELEIEPSAETRSLIAAVRARSQVHPSAALPAGSVLPPSPAVVAAAVTSTDVLPASAAVERVTRPSSRKGWRMTAAAIVLAVGGMALGALALHRRPAAAATGTLVEVVPFGNHPARDDLGSLAAALTAEVVRELGAVEGLRVREVRPANGSVSAGGVSPASTHAGEPPRTVVLRGDLVQAGGRTRVDIRLLGAGGEVMAAHSVEHAAGDTLALLDDLARAIATLVRTDLGREVRRRELVAGKEGPQFRELLQAAEDYRRRSQTLESADAVEAALRALVEADSLLRQAERIAPLDPEPALARARLAKSRAVILLTTRLRNPAAADLALREGIAESDRAVTLDSMRSTGQSTAGELRYLLWLTSRADRRGSALARAAEDRLRRAAALDPTNTAVLTPLSALLEAEGDFAGANLAAQKAFRADKYLEHPEELAFRLFTTSFEIGDDSAAASWCAELSRRDQHGFGATYCRLFSLAWGDEPRADAEREIGDVLKRADEPHRWEAHDRARLQLLAATIFAREGMRGTADSLISATRAAVKQNPELLVLYAGARQALGGDAAAVAALVRYARLGFPDTAAVLRSRRFGALRPALRRALGDEGAF